MFSINPIPLKVENMMMVITAVRDYILVNVHFDQFYLLNAVEYNKCVKFGRDNVICRQQHPIYSREANIDSCKFGLIIIGHMEAISEKCQLTTAINMWVQLHNPNH